LNGNAATASTEYRAGVLARLRHGLLPKGDILSDEAWEVRHTAIVWIALAHSVVMPFVGYATGNGFLHSLAESSVVTIAALVARHPGTSRTFRTIAAVLSLITASALLVHFSGGLIEMHFHFFVMVGIVTLYQSWTPFLFAIGYVVVHHGVAGSIAPEDVFNHPAALASPWTWAAIHGFFILGMSAAGLAAWKFSEDAQRRAISNERKRAVDARSYMAAQAEAQARLRQSEERFRALVQHSSDCVCVMDAETNFTYVTPSIERILGYTPEEFVDVDRASLVHEDDLIRVADAYSKVFQEEGAVARFEGRFRAKDGSYKWVDAALTNLLHDPYVRGVVANFYDITERRSIEAQLRQSQKMDAIGRLAGGVAHDFNNILSVITNTASFLRDGLPEGDEALQEDVTEIENASRRATALVSQLLAFARQDHPQNETIDLNSVVRDAEKMLRRTIGEHIDLRVHLEDSLQGVFIDPNEAGQILMNLAVNARDAMPGGGTLTITTGEDPQGDVILSVGDTGAGMDEDTQQSIFEPFFTTKPVGLGTGLGLSTVFGIVQKAGGLIDVDSEPGHGTTFTIVIPGAGPVQLAGAEIIAVEAPPATGSILVVEDEDGVRRVAKRILEGAGYTVRLATNGEEAIEMYRAEPADMVLSDVVMPGLSGIEVVSKIRAIDPTARALFMSGYTPEIVTGHGLPDDGRVVRKPFDSTTLLEAVRACFERSPTASTPAGTSWEDATFEAMPG
jgi:PAS domain S-box-containing protein